MNITEEKKQEAEEVLKLYTPKDAAGFDTLPRRISIRFAIQNRQSVLEENKYWLKRTSIDHEYKRCIECGERIQSLTNQIDYLKTKI